MLRRSFSPHALTLPFIAAGIVAGCGASGGEVERRAAPFIASNFIASNAITTNKTRSSGDPLIGYFKASTIVETLCFIIPS